jgi:hypothetical protein
MLIAIYGLMAIYVILPLVYHFTAKQEMFFKMSLITSQLPIMVFALWNNWDKQKPKETVNYKAAVLFSRLTVLVSVIMFVFLMYRYA